jgi:formylmethanofuran dehydrogenase subunit C
VANVETVRVRVPVLARLILSDLAARRGEAEEVILAQLIQREAVAELGRQLEVTPEATDAAAR